MVVASLCLTFVTSSFMVVYSRTLQRSADDLVRIKGNPDLEAIRCRENHGEPQYIYVGQYNGCEYKKQ